MGQSIESLCESNNTTLVSYLEDGLVVRCNICGVRYFTGVTRGFKPCPNCEREMNHRSFRERQICNMLDYYGIHYENNKVFDDLGFEVDVFAPDFKVAFEINGFYWHNSGNYKHSKTPGYHSNKTKCLLSKGIRLYHFWDNVSLELCFSEVKRALGIVDIVYVSDPMLEDLAVPKAREFFRRNHIDSFSSSEVGYAYSDSNRIYCAFTMKRISSSTWELTRFAEDLNIHVCNGYETLWRYVLNNLEKSGCKQVLCKVDKDNNPQPDKTVPSLLGFDLVYEGSPVKRYWVSRDLEFAGKKFSRGDVLGYNTVHKLAVSQGINRDRQLEELGIQPYYNSGVWNYRLCL